MINKIIFLGITNNDKQYIQLLSIRYHNSE